MQLLNTVCRVWINAQVPFAVFAFGKGVRWMAGVGIIGPNIDSIVTIAVA